MNGQQTAEELLANGYEPIAMLHGLKVPAEKWKRWEAERMTRESIAERWEGTRNGVAILCRDLVVLDVDAPEKLGMVLASCGLTDAPICRTPRGGYHVHARMRRGVERSRKIRLHGEPVDLLTGMSLSILPPHTNEHGVPYEWITEGLPHISELPLARMAWTREVVRRVVTRVEVVDEGDRAVRRARAYIATIEGAISGQGGHNRTFRVACLLRKRFGLTFAQAWPLFKEWNEQCEPPWSDRDLAHKLDDAGK
jgi:hypothetical protein